jgi:hypothetical protein
MDADLYLPSLLEGSRGTRQWMAPRLGRVWRQVEERGQASCGQNKRAHGGKAKEDRERLSFTGSFVTE